MASLQTASTGLLKDVAEAELSHMLDVLQTAEALQAKLAAMPEHLRVPLSKHCADLHAIIREEQVQTNAGELLVESGGN